MSNQTIYPYGTDGELPSSIGLINDLVTGGVDKALTAEQGKILKNIIDSIFSFSAKEALLTALEHVAWVDQSGSSHIASLRALLMGSTLVSIRAEYDQQHTIWSDEVSSLDDLKQDLIIYGLYDNGTEALVTTYNLSGTLSTGTSTITVSYQECTTQFNVVVTEYGSQISYSMASGDVINAKGEPSYYRPNNAYYQAINNYGTSNTRRFFGCPYGKKKLVDTSGNPIEMFPFKIPSGCTKAVVNIVPNTQYIAIRLCALSGDYYQTMGDIIQTEVTASWQQGQNTIDFSLYANRNDIYIVAWSKYNNTGSSYPTEPSNLQITFQ